MARFNLPYHQSTVSVDIPDELVAGVLESEVSTQKPDMAQEEIVRNALNDPIQSPPLEDLVRGKKTLTLVTSDHTRPVPSRITLPILLERIRQSQQDIHITILVATGYHRATTQEELKTMFGDSVMKNERIVIHDSRDSTQMINLGLLPSGGKLWINRQAIETDMLIAEGFIEPHFFAGFSGGRKSILPGIAGYKTVLANHCAGFIAHKRARTGLLKGNPIHEDMIFAAQKANLQFILNVVLNGKKEIIHAVAGHREAAHQQGCDFLSQLCRVKARPADIVITTNGGYPLDQNIYQSVKGMTAAEATTYDGGIIIMVSACNDGHGGESFYQNLAAATHPREILKRTLRIPRDETVPDQWEYQILARILNRFRVILVTELCDPNMITAMHMDHASTVGEALEKAWKLKGRKKVTIIPDGVGVIVGK
jgi:nickel-dependent lactate racemase